MDGVIEFSGDRLVDWFVFFMFDGKYASFVDPDSVEATRQRVRGTKALLATRTWQGWDNLQRWRWVAQSIDTGFDVNDDGLVILTHRQQPNRRVIKRGKY